MFIWNLFVMKLSNAPPPLLPLPQNFHRFTTLVDTTLVTIKADYSSERAINLNPNNQLWLSQLLLSSQTLSDLIWIWNYAPGSYLKIYNER